MANNFRYEAAEHEADNIALKFTNSTDVVGDMSRAYHTDFSGIRMHDDAAAQAKVAAAGKVALASGKDLYFGKGILDGANPASSGVIAHELAHTMQQGLVGGDSSAVSEYAPAGAEQGLSWSSIKKFFGRGKSKKAAPAQHLGSKPATDDASLQYMKMMREALGGEDKLRKEELQARMNYNVTASREKMAEADAQWDAYANDPSGNLMGISTAYQAFGHRINATNTGKNNRRLNQMLLGGTMEGYREQIKKQDVDGVDFVGSMNNLQQFMLASKMYETEDTIADLASGIYDVVAEQLMTDEGLDYVQSLVQGVEGAKVFQETGLSPLNYVMTTILTEEGIKAKNAMYLAEGFTQTGERNEARKQVGIKASKLAMAPTLMEQVSEEERNELPPSVQILFAQYQNICAQITEALQKRGASA